ncbi:hypothetical protein AC230_17765 [Streptomyces caatingaensis]|uniref:Permease n=2 Tax=Streptomyces caatingaensis TaxID=1678637 RepID=A0A0K9XCN8_9ACTN|nr:hypothetical protein AC230_17765 [Streptomyces caatingaensis]
MTTERSGLRRQLYRIGRSAGRRSGGGRIRAVALLLAGLFLTLGLSSVVALHASYDGIHVRTEKRSLQFRDAKPGERPTLLAIDGFDEVGGLQHSVVYVRPLTADAPLPPGVDTWPAPGQAVLSPGLVRALEEEGATGRFGEVIGRIGDDGLASPGERMGYVNPTDRQAAGASFRPAVGFGGPRGDRFGDVMFIKDRGHLMDALLLVLLPAVALAVVAARMGSAARDKRTAVVSALGGTWRARFWLNMGEAAPPVLAGTVLGALPGAAVAVTGNVRLPWIGYRLSAADLRHWWWGLLLSGVLAAAAVLLLVCLMHRTGGSRRVRSPRAVARGHGILRWAAVACPVLVLATVWGPGRLDPQQYADLRGQLYDTGVAAVLVTLPAVVALAAAAAGQRLARAARRTGAAALLVAGRHAAAHPGVTARVVAGVAMAMVVVSQIQLTSSQFGESAAQAKATMRKVGAGLLLMELRPAKVSRERLESVLRDLPVGIEALAARTEPGSSEPRTLFKGPCTALRSVSLPCTARPVKVATRETDPRVAQAVRWTGPVADGLYVQEGSVLDGPTTVPATLLLTSPSGRELPVSRLKQLVRDDLPIGSADVDVLGARWVLGANLAVAHGRWVIFLGVPGVVLLALALALANVSEFVRFSAVVAPLSVLTGSRRLYYGTAAWSLLAPLLAAIGTSFLVSVWLAAPQESPDRGITLSLGMLTGAAGVLATLSVVMWWWGARTAVRQAGQWRPYGD